MTRHPPDDRVFGVDVVALSVIWQGARVIAPATAGRQALIDGFSSL